LTWVSLALAASCVPVVANAQSALATEGPWLVRVRATNMLNDNGNSPNLALGQVEVQDRWIPEFDVSYFFTDNIDAELVLTWPQKVDVSLGRYRDRLGQGAAADAAAAVPLHAERDLPPYAGFGINYTYFGSQIFLIAGLDTSSSSWGPAVQAGFDFKIAPRWYLNADVKYVWMDTDVTLNGAKLTKVDISPWLISVGVGYRF
jgi:outer membrane protein